VRRGAVDAVPGVGAGTVCHISLVPVHWLGTWRGWMWRGQEEMEGIARREKGKKRGGKEYI
jgi:hypothetical protein